MAEQPPSETERFSSPEAIREEMNRVLDEFSVANKAAEAGDAEAAVRAGALREQLRSLNQLLEERGGPEQPVALADDLSNLEAYADAKLPRASHEEIERARHDAENWPSIVSAVQQEHATINAELGKAAERLEELEAKEKVFGDSLTILIERANDANDTRYSLKTSLSNFFEGFESSAMRLRYDIEGECDFLLARGSNIDKETARILKTKTEEILARYRRKKEEIAACVTSREFAKADGLAIDTQYDVTHHIVPELDVLLAEATRLARNYSDK